MRGTTARFTLRAAALLLTMAAGAPLGGCGMRNLDDAPARAVTVTASGPATLAVGDTLVVTLPANPSTGYSWALTSAPAAAVLAAPGEPAYTPDRTGGAPMPGAGGKATFRFAAVGAGSTRVVLAYRRGWETGVPPVETVTVEVTVTAGGG